MWDVQEAADERFSLIMDVSVSLYFSLSLSEVNKIKRKRSQVIVGYQNLVGKEMKKILFKKHFMKETIL